VEENFSPRWMKIYFQISSRNAPAGLSNPADLPIRQERLVIHRKGIETHSACNPFQRIWPIRRRFQLLRHVRKWLSPAKTKKPSEKSSESFLIL
jgi:hypothetical protein